MFIFPVLDFLPTPLLPGHFQVRGNYYQGKCPGAPWCSIITSYGSPSPCTGHRKNDYTAAISDIVKQVNNKKRNGSEMPRCTSTRLGTATTSWSRRFSNVFNSTTVCSVCSCISCNCFCNVWDLDCNKTHNMCFRTYAVSCQHAQKYTKSISITISTSNCWHPLAKLLHEHGITNWE